MTVLIVDDNEQNLYQLQVLLGGNGCQVVAAAHGAEALAKARQEPPDLVVSDILMPVMDGFALCREWKKDARLRSIPFIFYTATYTDERDREFALGLGAERFLVKPEEPEAFMHTLRDVIQQAQRPPAAPLAPAPTDAPPREDAGYLKQYNSALIRKLEAKTQQLEQANRELERDITARRHTEEALRQSEAKFRAIANYTVDLECWFGQDGKLLWVNPAVERITGYAVAEVLAMPDVIPILIAREDRALVIARLQAALRGARGDDFEFRYLHKNGAQLWLSVSWQPISGEQGESLGVRVSGRDVTARKRAAAAFREAQDLLNEVGSIARIGGWKMDLIARQATWTRGTYDIVEIAPGQPPPGPDEHLAYYLPEDRPRVAAAMRALIEDDTPLDFAARLRTAKGIVKWCRAVGRAVREGGKAVELHGTFQDVTVQRHAEDELARNCETQAALNALLRSSMECEGIAAFLDRALALILSVKWLAFESRGAVFLADETRQTLNLCVHKGFSQELLAICSTIPFGRCLCGRAAASRTVQFADRVDERHDTRYAGMPPHGHYCVPILSGNRVLGVLNLYVKEGHARDASEEDFLKAVANTLAGAIERQRAEAILREQVDELGRWHALTLGRETRVVELKREVNELLARGGEKPRYGSVDEDRGTGNAERGAGK